MQYEPVIGLEIHAQLSTLSKLFCGCSTEFGAEPNHQVCPVCLGLPGALPFINRAAVEKAVRAALALGCTIQERSVFARKNYFYPDLPKGYQISQFEAPFSKHGSIEISVGSARRRAGITRVHMEEDAGKNVHGLGGDTAVDLNRAGVPLIEIVGDPDLRSSAEAAAYMRAVREVLIFVGVNDGNLEEGSFRCDANVSIRPLGSETLGTRVELKNINSFRFVERAIDTEIARQAALLDSGKTVVQETRSFDPKTGKTATLRVKEDADDYRYFPDPDLPELVISNALVEAQRALIGELPAPLRARWSRDYGLSNEAVQTLSRHPEFARFFEAVVQRFPKPLVAANFIQTEVMRGARQDGLSATFSVAPEQVAELLQLVDEKKITGKQAKEVFTELEGSLDRPTDVVARRGLEVVSDEGALVALLEQLAKEHPKQIAAIAAGKKNVAGFFVGQVMKKTGGAADPQLVGEILQRIVAASGA